MKIKMYGVMGQAIDRVSKYLGDGWIKEKVEHYDAEFGLYDITIDAIVKFNNINDRVWIDYCGNKEYINADEFVKLEVF